MKKIILSLALFFGIVHADISDGHFGTNQIFDVQYSWSGSTLNAYNFIAPYDMNFQHPSMSTGQYFAFFNSTTNPGTYGLGLYNANGTLATTLHNTGTLQAIGPDALFYIGSGFFGTVITTSEGFAYGQNGSFTNMDTSVTSSDTSSYTWASTVPLSAGQTASSTPSAPSAPTIVSTSTAIVASSSNTVNSSLPVLTTAVTSYTSSVSGNIQNIARNVTTTVTTPMTTTSSSFTRTTDNYSDASVVVTDGTVTSTSTSWNNVVATDSTLPTLSGRIDGISTLVSSNKLLNRTFVDDVKGIQFIKHDTTFKNGLTSSTEGITIGGDSILGKTKLGVNVAMFNTQMINADSKTVLVSLRNTKEFEKFTTKVSVNYASTDLTSSRTIGDFANASSTKGDDRFASMQIVGKSSFEPIIGYTVGNRSIDGYIESGSSVSALRFDDVKDRYDYVTIGAQKTIDVFTFKVLRSTDGISDYSISINKDFKDGAMNIQVQRLVLDLANDTSIKAGFKFKF